MRPRRTITFASNAPLRISPLERYVPFTIDTTPIGPSYAVAMAPTASLDLLDDEATRRGTPCPFCFVERAVTGACDSH